ncbi:MAG TPA: hypothetical protein VFO05_03010, partial [Candidatus Limnocylindrales bacterium]|nr:hypothetical protein [Candidatus Limnocylindrales bacterium]
MARPEPFALIDTLREGSVSFAPPDSTDPNAHDPASGGHAGTSVGAGHMVGSSGLLGGASRDGVSGYPIQVGKVQRPPLREETLARHRLLDWLDVKIHNRVVFVIADAGYGKTTLLADFSRRTRLRTLWYRMDEEDRNWVTFLSYLVAAGREHNPDFAPRTCALLNDTSPGGPSRDETVATFLRELPDIAPTPTVLVLDDFHAADGSGDVSNVAKRLIADAPERLTVVVSSRRNPEIPVGRLRAQGELAELRTRDLQFSEKEISDLFRESTASSLDPESLALLNRQSEGWAASLELIRTALRGRSANETRDFIRNLSGAQSELYDYLAEEVVGDLRQSHQEFLMRTALLQSVTAAQAAAITGQDATTTAVMIEASERLGLITRQGTSPGRYRYHPLVRQFLAARLRSTIGADAVRALHGVAAAWASDVDWRAACYHYEQAQDIASLHGVLDRAIDRIAGQGGYELAAEYLLRFKPARTTASFEIIGSRVEHRHGDQTSALHRADHAVALAPDSEAALNNSITMHANAGDHDGSWKLARRLASSAKSDVYRAIARASCLRYESSIDGRISELTDVLQELVARSESEGYSHFAGVSHLNLSLAEVARGDVAAAIAHADLAVTALSETNKSDELASALTARAVASALLGRLDNARFDIAEAGDVIPTSVRAEWLVEAADIEASFGSADRASSFIREARATAMTKSIADLADTVEVRLALRKGDLAAAQDRAARFEIGAPCETPAFASRQLAIRAHVAAAGGAAEAGQLLADATRHAQQQGALFWVRYCQIADALYARDSDRELAALLNRTPTEHMPLFDLFAEPLSARLKDLGGSPLERLAEQCSSRPERWRSALRSVVANATAPGRWHAAEILDDVGTSEDVPVLRALARTARGTAPRSTLGRTLARRLAQRFVIEDLGRVEITSGSQRVPASGIRRKVLAMLCFLLTRPQFSATRDEVIDALWPDLAPDVAVNSLNQTVYFLRRVFEPTYVEDLSAGYVHHSSDVLWLDRELVASRSARCLDIIDAIGADPGPDLVTQLSTEYTERFALDFAYEEWAVPFRTSLHVAYLRVIEAAVTHDMANGHHDRAIELARRALDRDPSVESLELALLRLYRTTGAH